MEHFCHQTRHERNPMVIDSAIPKRNRIKYVAMLLATMAVAAFPPAGLTTVATAEPRTWDLELYDACIEWSRAAYQRGEITLQDLTEADHICCAETGGVWDADKEFCHAPSGDAHGSRQLPGNVRIPSDIATAPVVTNTPPRPIRVPSDIATAPAVSQAPG
jgi:hypothetical protein